MLIVMVFASLDIYMYISQVSSLHLAAASGKLDDVKRLVTTDVNIVNAKDEKQVRTYSIC